jgi:aspartyl protease family protein
MDSQDRRRNQAGPWGAAPRAPSRFVRRLLIILAVVLLLTFGLVSVAPPVQFETSQWAYIAQAVLILSVVVVGIAASSRRLSSLAGDAAIWLGLGLVLVVGYSYRFELNGLGGRVLGELMPAEGRALDDDAISFRRGQDQQFHIDALVDGRKVRFLVDTGASGVALNRADATRLGLAPDERDYTETFETANGVTHGAPVQLEQVRIGPLQFDHVPATVNEGDLRESLLGMRLLERLSTIEISKDVLTIRR